MQFSAAPSPFLGPVPHLHVLVPFMKQKIGSKSEAHHQSRDVRSIRRMKLQLLVGSLIMRTMAVAFFIHPNFKPTHIHWVRSK